MLATVLLTSADPSALAVDTARLDALALEAADKKRAKAGWEEAARTLARHPSAYEVQWRVARAAFFYGFVEDRERETTLHVVKRGWEIGQDAARSEPGRVEAHYWSACSLGEYARRAGVWTAVKEGLADKIRDSFERAGEIDAAYNEAGPLEALGRYYFELPWPLRDLKKSRGYLERAVKLAPQKLRLRGYYADVLVELDDETAAREHYRACAEGKARLERELDAARWQAHCKAQLTVSRRP